MTFANTAPVLEPRAGNRERKQVYLIALMVAAFLGWAWYFPLAEVSSGQGTVVPSSREQVIQSLEGGIIASLAVTEGTVVEANEVLAQLDPTRSVSNVDEAAAKYHASIAAAARLRAEINKSDKVSFPAALDGAAFEELRANERALFRSRRDSLQESMAGLTVGLKLLEEEVQITERLQRSGAASRVELIRLQREASQVRLDISQLRADYQVQASEELQRVNAEAQVQSSIMRGRNDQVARLTIRAPMRGVVQDVAITTIGGVVPPGGQLMTIVPIDDQLLIEARISPRDIAFIHPGQAALVKISAYDYAIFGGLEGEVVTISPNTVRDEIRPEQLYYRVFIRTQADFLVNADGTQFAITPGMIATVDIQTGEKTVWQYLIKPFNRAQEALRER